MSIILCLNLQHGATRAKHSLFTLKFCLNLCSTPNLQPNYKKVKSLKRSHILNQWRAIPETDCKLHWHTPLPIHGQGLQRFPPQKDSANVETFFLTVSRSPSVISTGTILPSLMYVSIRSPFGDPLLRSSRNSSPAERCLNPNFCDWMTCTGKVLSLNKKDI